MQVLLCKKNRQRKSGLSGQIYIFTILFFSLKIADIQPGTCGTGAASCKKSKSSRKQSKKRPAGSKNKVKTSSLARHHSGSDDDFS